MDETKPKLKSVTRPFLRWAGGKTWLVKYLTKVKESKFNNYHEIFLGGGATFFFLKPQNHSYLSDLNIELIKTYQTLKDDVEGVIRELKNFRNEEAYYYKVRETVFNDKLEQAAQFIYLNQTSFNGIHRVNTRGKYNVPYGFRKKDFLDSEGLRAASSALFNTTISNGDFYSTIDNIKAKDLVFLDPPYTVSHNNNGFIEYNEKIFQLSDQRRLSRMIDDIKKKDAYYILTNAAHNTIKEIFEKGDTRIELTRANAIGGAKAQRGQTSELIFTNIEL
ncbi:Dam family site-specific DNA-(adenine-N6)-methyltransferase [Mucilaginibacter mali]|uniref:site-specific DNA-methyltransferase (adenine-specific) n=1 Tax=Mucilaginibacter mali TaxID=2740462 RepID=A0A7D4Q7Y2_9SPHI|nr:Dam family site-specific DNA-(adenine-N6)-methyltransferase [Mucilaginibacter mali]QKJ29365.1 Dam family site-specific DNA-(adenine-N6)-methyltransferase [Mucilaginibacter mali]